MVVKANSLIEASYRLTLNEMRLLALTIGTMDPKSDQQIFEFSVAEFVNQFPDMNPERAYFQIKSAIERISERWVRTEDEKRITKFRWVSSQTYFKNEGRFQISLTNEIMPYLTQLKGQFTQYQLNHISGFSSSHAIRLYELLTQYRRFGERLITIDELKKWLQLENKYNLWAELQRWVIKPSLTEINEKSDLNIEVEKIKRGRVIHALKFVITPKRMQPTIRQPEPPAKPQLDLFDGFSEQERQAIQQHIDEHIKRLEQKGEIVGDWHIENITKKAVAERWGLDVLVKKQEKQRIKQEQKERELAEQRAGEAEREQHNQEATRKINAVIEIFERKTPEQQEKIYELISQKIPMAMRPIYTTKRTDRTAYKGGMFAQYFVDLFEEMYVKL